MRYSRTIGILVICIVALALFATIMGIFSTGGSGQFTYQSIRNQPIQIYGQGLYRDMSADVAVQGIAQDYVTLFVGIILLIVGWFWSKKSFGGQLFFLGVLSYFFVTYLFYMTMAMYNPIFLVYVALTGTSFFALVYTFLTFYQRTQFKLSVRKETVLQYCGWFLLINGVLIGFLWLGTVLPPLFDQSWIPVSVEHYTTLIVQGFDLSILLPLSIVCGWCGIRKYSAAYVLVPIYTIFLSLLMLALIAKIIAMGWAGQNIIPVIFIIPLIFLVSAVNSVMLLRNTMEAKME